MPIKGAAAATVRPFAWTAAGWETADVNMDAETLSLRRKPQVAVHGLDLDQAWPESVSLRREDVY